MIIRTHKLSSTYCERVFFDQTFVKKPITELTTRISNNTIKVVQLLQYAYLQNTELCQENYLTTNSIDQKHLAIFLVSVSSFWLKVRSENCVFNLAQCSNHVRKAKSNSSYNENFSCTFFRFQFNLCTVHGYSPNFKLYANSEILTYPLQ